jgi:hypothetical protein
MTRLSTQTRVECAALAVANVGAGMYVAGDDMVLDAGGFSLAFGLALILLALPAGVAATLGTRSRFSDEGTFLNAMAWVFVTVMSVQAHHENTAAYGLALVLLAGTLATFALWWGFARQEVSVVS